MVDRSILDRAPSQDADRTGRNPLTNRAQHPAYNNRLDHARPPCVAPQEAQESEPGRRVPTAATLDISEAELAAAELTPRCIIENYLYADIAQLAGPGSAGKTTLILYEAVHIALGLPVWGLKVLNPGWTLFVSAEDARPRLVARLREIMVHLGLSIEQRATALRGVRVWDVTGEGLRLVFLANGTVTLTSLADELVETFSDDPPAVLVFDPTVSFGASESLVNDNETGLITAGRRLVRGLDCCVRFLHHTGKANAREKTLDQYTGRGGSALADGSRMTCILQPWSPADRLKPPPTLEPDAASGVSILARAKLSYAPPDLPLIWIKRTGFRFTWARETAPTADEARAIRAERLLGFLGAELAAERYHTRTTLDAQAPATSLRSRAEVRQALADLEAAGRVVETELPAALKRGGRQRYLKPTLLAAGSGGVAPSDEPNPAEPEPIPSTPPPFRERRGGGVNAPPAVPPVPNSAGAERRSGGGVGGVADQEPEGQPNMGTLTRFLWRPAGTSGGGWIVANLPTNDPREAARILTKEHGCELEMMSREVKP